MTSTCGVVSIPPTKGFKICGTLVAYTLKVRGDGPSPIDDLDSGGSSSSGATLGTLGSGAIRGTCSRGTPFGSLIEKVIVYSGTI